MAQKVNKVKLVALAEIIADPRYQMRAELNQPMVERYQEFYEYAPDRLPPVKCIEIEGKFYLVEGFIRLAAAKRAGLKEIQVIILEGDANDGLWHALGSNKHGLQLSWGDMKKVVSTGLDSFPDKTNVEIAKHVGCSEGYIRKIRKERENRTGTNSEKTAKDKSEKKPENRTSTISEKKFDTLLDRIKTTVTQLSPDQKERLCQEIQSLLDDESRADGKEGGRKK